LQGDIIRICDTSGNTVVQYTYDAWGKLLSTTGTLASTVGQKNPFRYRGYYFDTETGLYYLQTRYYDPIVGRFINADGYVGANGGILGYNLFAYCNNNPVMGSDPAGEFVLSALIVGAIVCAAIGFGITAYADYKDDGKVFNGSIGAKSYFANTIVGGVVGGFTGGVGSSTFSLTIPTIHAAMTTAGSTVFVAGTTTVTIAGTQIVAGETVAVLGIMYSLSANRYKPKDSRKNYVQNEEFERLCDEYGLNQSQKDVIHRKISKKELSKEKIRKVIEGLFLK